MVTKKEELEVKRFLEKQREADREEAFKNAFLLNNTRAGKLLKNGKPFIVIAIDEPYFPEAYRLIRQSETKKGTWTERCEAEFQKKMDRWMHL